ncbi:hypothetical protein SDC9_115430 [bioreactor metagenome]|uniref:Uncharacterized protein n=1 Tax=bioreactor metagenome TaxID=1076179 RepID=A0A645BTF7_9ZZZZ
MIPIDAFIALITFVFITSELKLPVVILSALSEPILAESIVAVSVDRFIAVITLPFITSELKLPVVMDPASIFSTTNPEVFILSAFILPDTFRLIA